MQPPADKVPLGLHFGHRLSDIDAVAALRKGNGPELRIWGSSALYPLLLGAGLLDRLILLTYPLVLGKGKRLFAEGTPPQTFALRDHTTGPGGAAIATLDPVGEVRVGASPVAPPNPREMQRQRRIAEGSW